MPARYISPPDPMAFNERVWELVRQIPFGRVVTYGQLAAQIPVPESIRPETYRALGPRWVGGAMARCPADVPWHRVVNAQGRISLRKGNGHFRQRELLISEGIVFDAQGRIDLEKFGWR